MEQVREYVRCACCVLITALRYRRSVHAVGNGWWTDDDASGWMAEELYCLTHLSSNALKPSSFHLTRQCHATGPVSDIIHSCHNTIISAMHAIKY